LITLLETVLGPFWVWLALDEVPTEAALVGGLIVIAALAFNSVAMLRAPPPRARISPA
jgi:drug/metabolite transporter (DMT)-like permease